MSTYGYCRVSTTVQAIEGESLDVQRRRIEGYAHQHGWVVSQVFVERGVSGGRPLEDRPQGGKLLAALRSGDVVICPKLDRMFRSATNALNVLEDLKRREVKLHLLDMGGDVTGNGISQLMFTMLSAFAQFERERLQERIREVKRDQKSRGRYLGGRKPFGYEVDDGALVPVQEELDAIELMRAMRAAGRSYYYIATIMSGDGFPLSHMGVKKILARAQPN